MFTITILPNKSTHERTMWIVANAGDESIFGTVIQSGTRVYCETCKRPDCHHAYAIIAKQDDDVTAWLAEMGHDPGCGGQEFSDEEIEAQRRRDAELDAMFDALESEPVCPFCNRFCDEYSGEPNQKPVIECAKCGDVTDAIEREQMQ